MSERKRHNPLNFFQEHRNGNQQRALDKSLIECCAAGDEDAVIDLLEKGASPEGEAQVTAQIACGEDFKRPLMAAVMNGHKKIAQLLLENGAEASGRNRYNVRPLHLAAHSGHRDCVRLLLEAGADANAETSDYNKPGVYKKPFRGGTTPLHMAAKLNQTGCIEELVERGGADVNRRDVIGMTCLSTACQLGHEESVLTILRITEGRSLEVGVAIGTGNTPLHDCVRCGLVQATEALLKRGALVNKPNPTGYTPLHFAMIQTGPAAPRLVQTLVLHGRGVDVNLPNRAGLRPLHMVAFKPNNTEHIHHIHTIEYHMARDHITLDPGRPRRDPAMTCFLLQYGADFNLEYHEVSLLQHEIYCHDDENDDDDESVILETILRSTASFPIPPKPRGGFLDNEPLSAKVSKRLAMLNEVFGRPRSLQQYCRLKVRHLLTPRRLNRVQEIGLPDRLQDYILLKS